MSSAPPGRYQSRFFNFLNRQSLRLTDGFDRTIRNLKVAAVWGAQILLYPVYLLAQTSLSIGRQLASEAEAGWPRLKEFTKKEPPETPPVADTPIQRVLEELNVECSSLQLVNVQLTKPEPQLNHIQIASLEQGEKLQNLSEKDYWSVLSPSPVKEIGNLNVEQLANLQPSISIKKGCLIQGVASLLETRALVLVSVENQILDILTPDQQRKLAAKISWEVANLLRQQRLARLSKGQHIPRRFKNLNRPGVFLPVRLFGQFMAWMQTSTVAIAANVFQESTLIEMETAYPAQLLLNHHQAQSTPQLPASHESIVQNQLALQEALVFLDRTIAELESHQLVPGTEVVGKLSESLRDRWNSSPLAKLSLQNLTRNRISNSSDAVLTNQESQTHSFRIQALIYAAIEYFFGKRNSNLSGTDNQEQQSNLGHASGKFQPLSGRRSSSLSSAQLHHNLELPDAGEPDPWLSWVDLYGNLTSESVDHSTAISSGLKPNGSNPDSPVQLPEAFNSKIPITPRNSVWGVLKRFLGFHPARKTPSQASTHKPTLESYPSVGRTGKLTTTQKTPPLATQNEDKGSTVTSEKTPPSVAVAHRSTNVLPAKTESTAIATSSASSQNTALEPAPDWIETRATTTGYVKHPLEQLLEWLDRAMLRVEEFAVKVWHWLFHT
jgi:hypothetical protein